MFYPFLYAALHIVEIIKSPGKKDMGCCNGSVSGPAVDKYRSMKIFCNSCVFLFQFLYRDQDTVFDMSLSILFRSSHIQDQNRLFPYQLHRLVHINILVPLLFRHIAAAKNKACKNQQDKKEFIFFQVRHDLIIMIPCARSTSSCRN